ncbi:MAG TPA: hypothetical protein VKH81_16105 [Candidatus Angelobacter sp.]|nr:hypothetical protein [Candidatus Angelobacter sp.]
MTGFTEIQEIQEKQTNRGASSEARDDGENSHEGLFGIFDSPAQEVNHSREIFSPPTPAPENSLAEEIGTDIIEPVPLSPENDKGEEAARPQTLGKFIQEAAAYNLAALEQRDEHKTDGKEWHIAMFHFVRRLKDHPQLHFLSADDALRKVLPYIEEWDDVAREEHCVVSREEEFVRAWKKVRFGESDNPLQKALELARAKPLKLCRKLARSDRYATLVSLAFHLQLLVGIDEVIQLPCELLAAVLGCSKNAVSTWREFAIEDGFLELVRQHAFSATQRHATDFRFRLGRVDSTTLAEKRDEAR